MLCDVQMPGDHDGIWLSKELRRRFRECAVVLITSDHFVPATTSLKAGVVAYLVKPFTAPQVLAALRAAVDWHAAASSAPNTTNDSANPVNTWLDEIE